MLVRPDDRTQTVKILSHILQEPHDYVGNIRSEILAAVAKAPKLEQKNYYIAMSLDQLFGDHDWKTAFDRPQVIVCEEIITAEILQGLHAWLRTKATDITNIVLICTSNVGVAEWWHNWCKLYHEKSFRVHEVFYTSPLGRSYWHATFSDREFRSLEYFKQNKSTDKLFVYLGGTYTSHQREYVTLQLTSLALDAHIEHTATFGDRQSLLDYVEWQTYFVNQKQVDLISAQYLTHVNVDGGFNIKQLSSELSSHRNLSSETPAGIAQLERHWDIDRSCWATVARETLDDNFFACVSEKILRAFWHHTVCMPLGYRAVTDLERWGFWFPHDVVDYSYQNQRCFADRVEALCRELTRLSRCFKKEQLHQYYLDNIQNFQHNTTRVQTLLEDAQHLAESYSYHEFTVSGATA